MAFKSLFVRNVKSFSGVVFDATISESHNAKVELTRFPVEHGADITDHAVIEPKELTIVAWVTDSPLNQSITNEIIESASGLFGQSNNIFPITRSSAVFNRLMSVLDSRAPLIIQTGLKQYSNMIMTGFSVSQDASTSKALPMVINLREVRIVKTAIVPLSSDTLPPETQKQASAAQDRGQVAPVTEKKPNSFVDQWQREALAQ
jgi:hypothetical protein